MVFFITSRGDEVICGRLGYVSRSNVGPNSEPAASSPSTSTIISPLAIGDSTSSPWLTTIMMNQASWPLISSSPFSSSSLYLQRSRCCPPSKVRPDHSYRNHLPEGDTDTLTRQFHWWYIKQRNHKLPDVSADRVWISERGYASGRTVHY